MLRLQPCHVKKQQGELEARNRDMQQQKLELEHVQLVCKSQNMQDRESLRHQRQVVQLERERVQACKEVGSDVSAFLPLDGVPMSTAAVGKIP